MLQSVKFLQYTCPQFLDASSGQRSHQTRYQATPLTKFVLIFKEKCLLGMAMQRTRVSKKNSGGCKN